MVSGFICGTSNFPHEDNDFERQTRSAGSSPIRTRFKSSSNKNPYSSRGLDKFSSLLAKIDEKRRQIYSQVDPDEISLVRFAYSGDNDFKPIIVKAKPKSQPKTQFIDDQKVSYLRKLESSKSMKVNEENNSVENEDEVFNKKSKKMGFCKNLIRIDQWKKPKLILFTIIILILVFLVLFGRSFAIMCTSIGWYAIPTIIPNNYNSSSNMKVCFKKKNYAIRKLSHKKIMTSEGENSFKKLGGRS